MKLPGLGVGRTVLIQLQLRRYRRRQRLKLHHKLDTSWQVVGGGHHEDNVAHSTGAAIDIDIPYRPIYVWTYIDGTKDAAIDELGEDSERIGYLTIFDLMI